MPFNPEIHHRRSIRLRNYDYSQNGAYFVTVCVNKKLELLGNIADYRMVLNSAGKMVSEIWEKLPEKFDGVFLDEYCVMPNHFHGILIIDNKTVNMGEQLRYNESGRDKSGRDKSRPYGGNVTLGAIIRWFKGRTTFEIRNRRGDIYDALQNNTGNEIFDPMFAWQRNYYEHVIRNEPDIEGIRRYILENPVSWKNDEDNPSAHQYS